jgi:hypothetical protein
MEKLLFLPSFVYQYKGKIIIPAEESVHAGRRKLCHK